MIRSFSLALALLVGGCATSSGIYEVQPGLYKMTSSAFTTLGGAAQAKGTAYKAATDKCAGMGKHMSMVDQTAETANDDASVDITFRCE